MVTVFVPPMLRHLTGGDRQADVEAETLGDLIDLLDGRFPGFRDAVLEEGELRPGLAVSVGSEIATLGVMEPLPTSAEVHFLPAISGG